MSTTPDYRTDAHGYRVDEYTHPEIARAPWLIVTQTADGTWAPLDADYGTDARGYGGDYATAPQALDALAAEAVNPTGDWCRVKAENLVTGHEHVIDVAVVAATIAALEGASS